MDDTCCVCIETFTKQAHRKQAKCPYCDVKACTTCTQTYLLGTTDDPHCMGCRRGWTREVLDQILLTTWVNGAYKKHRENILMDRERSRLPAAQIIVERQKQAKERQPLADAILEKIGVLQREINILQEEYYTELRIISQLNHGLDPWAGTAAATTQKSAEERRVFVMPCPAADCRGFLSQAYKCGVCDVFVCPECREVKGLNRDAPHTCNPDTVASVQRLKKECRGCPECGTQIFKIEGCFAENVPILMWDNSTKLSQNIQVGDILVGDDGNQRIVEQTMSGQDMLYEVKQNNGATYIVNSKHTLVLQHTRDKMVSWKPRKKHYLVSWFDREKNIKRVKSFKPLENESKPQTIQRARDFLESLQLSNAIEIRVDDYMNLSELSKRYLVGYKLPSRTEINTYIYSKLTVSPIGSGNYYGWSVDGNKRFLHSDFTVLRNCDQMFCTNCNTPFSWTTGKKVTTGAIHNPHYFEYLRKMNNGVQPRTPGDIPCLANLPGAWEFDRHIRKFHSIPKVEFDALYKALMNLHHIHAVEIPYVTNRAEDNDSTDYAVRYLLKEIDETRWKQLLQQKEKKRLKKDEIRQLYEALIAASIDIFGRLMALARGTSILDRNQIPVLIEETKTTHANLLQLVKLFNQGMMEISRRYKCKVLVLNELTMARESKKFVAPKKVSEKKKKTKTKDEKDYAAARAIAEGDDTDDDTVEEIEDDDDEAPQNVIVQTK